MTIREKLFLYVDSVTEKGEEMIKHLWHAKFEAYLNLRSYRLWYRIWIWIFIYQFIRHLWYSNGSKNIFAKSYSLYILQRKFYLIVYSSLLIHNFIFQLAKNKKITSRYFYEHIFQARAVCTLSKWMRRTNFRSFVVARMYVLINHLLLLNF